MTDRRNFLRGMVALSAAAIPVVTQAAALDPWDKLAAGLAILNPNLPAACLLAKRDGMNPDWIYSIVATPNAKRPSLLFETPDGRFCSYYPDGRSGS